MVRLLPGRPPRVRAVITRHDQVLALARHAEARTIALHHHDPDRDDDALDAIAADAARWAREHAPAMRAVVAREGETFELR